MSKYVDAYILPIRKKNVAAYRVMARVGHKVWRELGALDYRECVGEDFNAFCGIGFPKQLKLRKDETLIFAYIVFRSRAHRDRVNRKAMSDPRLAAFATQKMPFDVDRMLYAGFSTIVGD